MRYKDDARPVMTLTTGPVEAYPDVLRALGRAVLFDNDLPFQQLYERVVDKASRAMRLANKALILQAEPIVGLEAAAASLIGRGDVVLNLVSGAYGRGFGVLARRHSPNVLELEVPDDEAIDPEALAARLRANPEISVVAVCHHETPAGIINPIDPIGALVAAHGAYLIVDAVSSFGGMDTHPRQAHADVYVTGPAKCLGCPPGLTLVGVSERGWDKIRANPTAPRGSVLSMLDWENAGRPDRPFPFTPSIAEINGLDAALDLYLGEGPENAWARHAVTAQATRAGLRAMGLALWARTEAIASPTTTAFRMPGGIEERALRHTVRSRYGLVLAPGRGPTEGKATRIGHMGPTAHPVFALAAVSALGGALSAMGRRTNTGAGIEAALAAIDKPL